MNLEIKGRQGKRVFIAGDSVRIEKRGFLTGRREKALPIRNISSVEVKKPGAFVGFIQFSIAGGKARDSSFSVSGGAIGAVKDENSVVFMGAENYEIALKIKSYVEAWAAPSDRGAPGSVADEIRKLKALLDDGTLTAPEFAAEKARILHR